MGKGIRINRGAIRAVMVLIWAAILIVAFSSVAFAWGPNRQTFTVADPATFITFNSITDNPHIGDERNFVGIRERGTNNLWSSNLQVHPGREYVVRMYVHNNAADHFGLVAEDVRALMNMPTATARSHNINGSIESSNAEPQRVWDNVTIWAEEDFNIYVVSVHYFNNHFTSGIALPNDIFTSNGTFLGFDALDGLIPGCFRYDGTVQIVIRPQFASGLPLYNLLIDSHVRPFGETDTDSWQRRIVVSPGDIVEYQIRFQNASNVTVENVQVRHILPDHLTYVAGSTTLFNTNHLYGVHIPDDATFIGSNITNVGINIGSYLPGGDAFVRFQVQVARADIFCSGIHDLYSQAQAWLPVDTNTMRENTSLVTVVTYTAKTPEIPENDTSNESHLESPEESSDAAAAFVFTHEMYVGLIDRLNNMDERLNSMNSGFVHTWIFPFVLIAFTVFLTIFAPNLIEKVKEKCKISKSCSK